MALWHEFSAGLLAHRLYKGGNNSFTSPFSARLEADTCVGCIAVQAATCKASEATYKAACSQRGRHQSTSTGLWHCHHLLLIVTQIWRRCESRRAGSPYVSPVPLLCKYSSLAKQKEQFRSVSGALPHMHKHTRMHTYQRKINTKQVAVA